MTDYQILTTIDTTTLITAGKMRSDCGDIRFTDTDGSTLLSYWIESDCNTVSTKIWVKIPSIPVGTNTIYIYYNNPTATYDNLVGGTNTFMFFDDFLGSSMDTSKWQRISSGGSTTVSNSILDMWTTTSAYETWIAYNKYPVNSSAIVRFKISTDASTGAGVGLSSDGTSSYAVWEMWAGKTWSIWNSPNQPTITRTADYSSYHTARINRVGTTSVDFYTDGVYDGNISTYIPSSSFGGYLYITSRTNNVHLYVDWFAIAKYASPEPTSSISVTEELGITAIDMILNTNTCVGSCQIIAGVTWQNLGSSNVTFTPAILIDGTTIAYATSNITIGPSPATGSSTITTPTLLAGTHTICPYPN